jgi:hypothetical protein
MSVAVKSKYRLPIILGLVALAFYFLGMWNVISG